MFKLLITFGTLALLAAPAAAEEAKQASQVKVAEKDPVVCKRIQDIQWRTASYKICFTRSKWRQIARDLQHEIDDYGRSGSFGSIGG